MNLTRLEREREAFEDWLVADIGVEVSYLEHLLVDFHAVCPALPQRNGCQKNGVIEKEHPEHPNAKW